MGQLDMNHALVMALATIHLGNVTATLGNAIAVDITMEQLVKVTSFKFQYITYINTTSTNKMIL